MIEKQTMINERRTTKLMAICNNELAMLVLIRNRHAVLYQSTKWMDGWMDDGLHVSHLGYSAPIFLRLKTASLAK